jgi:hypothetical protein
MTKKALIAAAAGVLVCGACVSPALAKAKHHHHATQAAAQPQAPTMPGNNPIVNPKPAAPIAGAQASGAIVGNNPMANPKPSAGAAAGAPPPSAVVGNNPMAVAKK